MTTYAQQQQQSGGSATSRAARRASTILKMPAAFRALQQEQAASSSPALIEQNSRETAVVEPSFTFDKYELELDPPPRIGHVDPGELVAEAITSSDEEDSRPKRLSIVGSPTQEKIPSFSRPVHRTASSPNLAAVATPLKKQISYQNVSRLPPPVWGAKETAANNRISSTSTINTITTTGSLPESTDRHKNKEIKENSITDNTTESLTAPIEPDTAKQHSSTDDDSANFSKDVEPSTTPDTTFQSSRDRYGFKKQTQFVTEAQYDEWWSRYQHHLQRRKKKWVRFMKESGLSTANDQPVRFPAKSEKLKRYIRKGIPAEWRGNAWFFYAKGYDKLSSNKGLYDKLCAQMAGVKNHDTELIERDLHRTFPDNIHFRNEEASDGGRSRETETVMITSLRKVLTAFSVYQPKIGYCQSLNFLAGLLLLFMDEERAFWMLVIITQRYLPGVHEITLEGVNVDQGVLMLCVREALPKMWAKVGVNFDGEQYKNIITRLPPITLCTAGWFMSGFIGIMPVETVLRVWDCFFFEESKTFFRIALTIFKLAEPEVEKLEDPMEIFQVVQTMPKRLIDASGLLAACFKRRNGFGHISQEEIRRLGDFVRERRQQANLKALKETNGSGGNNNGTADDAGADEVDDLEEYYNFRHASRPLHMQLSRRMRSLRLPSNTTSATVPPQPR